ncbi:membrane associated rhomboid family serine protease [Scopulibacillus daqui]|uniref:Membrane associated rhomboid family serine protease n=1 Tax=Scopulibacillus daqui TaxID=1469162 RepID=A0ABS2PX79_9BACL|nr:membrane associated rhomboid family serine protease [Scopulibacillus daqui]
MFVRNENFKTFIRLYPIVTCIIAINILVYLIIFLDKITPSGIGYSILSSGIGFNAAIAYGEWWRLITPIFLHITFPHILFNCFSILLFAPALELLLGKWRFIAAYLGAGFISNLASFIFQPMGYTHLGASGAIFGLFGIYLYMVAIRRDLIDKTNTTIIVVILILGLISTFIYPDIDVLGHLFGFLGGFILAPFLLLKVKENPYINNEQP